MPNEQNVAPTESAVPVAPVAKPAPVQAVVPFECPNQYLAHGKSGNLLGKYVSYAEFCRANGIEPTWKMHAAKNKLAETDESQKAQWTTKRDEIRTAHDKGRPAFFQASKDTLAKIVARPEIDVAQLKYNPKTKKTYAVLSERKDPKTAAELVRVKDDEIARLKAELAAVRAATKAAAKTTV